MKGTLGKSKALQGNAGTLGVAFLAIAATVADTETVTIGDTTWEADTDDTITEGNIAVDLSGGAGAAASITAFTAAFNAHADLDAYAVTGGIIVVDRNPKGGPLTCSETLAGSGNAWSQTTFIGQGAPAGDGSNQAAIVARAATAQEVTDGILGIAFRAPVVSALVQVRTPDGAVKAHDGDIAINGNLVTVDNAGSTDFAENDLVTIVAGF